MSGSYFPHTDQHTEIIEADDQYQVCPKGSPTLRLATVRFQRGPVKEAGVNGVFVEDLLRIALAQIEKYQTAEAGRYSCGENAEAMAHVMRALDALDARTKKREACGALGTSQV
jgi:hypothetical protein